VESDGPRNRGSASRASIVRERSLLGSKGNVSLRRFVRYPQHNVYLWNDAYKKLGPLWGAQKSTYRMSFCALTKQGGTPSHFSIITVRAACQFRFLPALCAFVARAKPPGPILLFTQVHRRSKLQDSAPHERARPCEF